jgi:phage terminase large subunit-like protein
MDGSAGTSLVGLRRYPDTTQSPSPAIIKLDAAMRAGSLRHDGNPVLTWCIGNVVGKADRRGNSASEEKQAGSEKSMPQWRS